MDGRRKSSAAVPFRYVCGCSIIVILNKIVSLRGVAMELPLNLSLLIAASVVFLQAANESRLNQQHHRWLRLSTASSLASLLDTMFDANMSDAS